MRGDIRLSRSEIKISTVLHTTNSCDVVRQHTSHKSSVGYAIVTSICCGKPFAIFDARAPVPELNDTQCRM